MVKLTAILLSAVTACALPSTVHAADLLATYTGFITGENAGDTIFGGHAAIGDALTASFYYSTSVPGTRTTMSGVSDEVSGGLDFGTDTVISKAIFTAGGYSFSYMPDYYSDVYASPGFLDAYALDGAGHNSQTFIYPDRTGFANLEAPFSSDGTGDAGGPLTQYSFVTDGNSTIDFNASHVAISALPEPSTWALMCAGVGALGLMLRRRRSPKDIGGNLRLSSRPMNGLLAQWRH